MSRMASLFALYILCHQDGISHLLKDNNFGDPGILDRNIHRCPKLALLQPCDVRGDGHPWVSLRDRFKRRNKYPRTLRNKPPICLLGVRDQPPRLRLGVLKGRCLAVLPRTELIRAGPPAGGCQILCSSSSINRHDLSGQ